jgi:hypothetical protein
MVRNGSEEENDDAVLLLAREKKFVFCRPQKTRTFLHTQAVVVLTALT